MQLGRSREVSPPPTPGLVGLVSPAESHLLQPQGDETPAEAAARAFDTLATTAADLAKRRADTARHLPFGVRDADALLAGGIATGEVCEIVGAGGLGSSIATELCLAAVAQCVGSSDAHAVYLDTSLGFRATRLYELLRERFHAQPREALKARLESQVRVLHAHGLVPLTEAVDAVASELALAAASGVGWAAKLKLLVVDSAFAPLHAERIEVPGSLAGAQMARLQHALRQLAYAGELAVLVTNVSIPATGVAPERPALGTAWQHTAHVRLLARAAADAAADGSGAEAAAQPTAQPHSLLAEGALDVQLIAQSQRLGQSV